MSNVVTKLQKQFVTAKKSLVGRCLHIQNQTTQFRRFGDCKEFAEAVSLLTLANAIHSAVGRKFVFLLQSKNTLKKQGFLLPLFF